ncbi:tyrosine-type recombinase/integrase [Streptomyces atratus]|uniref:tyrosine-type recombinase/integrase n=1 Tax=Streptomyces atratus TaxID=1893 RepID=UPI00225959E5|nr:site-specific integrase [Streptomyces atratus]MCX5345805.1 site-specific integrase [Streptomyces atratus]
MTNEGGTGVKDQPGQAGLADVLTLQRRAFESSTPADERTLFQDTLAEYCWARDVAGLAAKTLQTLVAPVLEICTFYDVVPWRLTSRELDRYFAGPGKPGRHTTMRSKLTRIDGYFAFLEQRYAGEIMRRFGAAVESPVDAFNRPRHRGDFGLRIPPSARAMKEFFASWRDALPTSRKYPVSARNYVMSKLTYISGVRAAELCAVRMGDVHWENGQWGRFLVFGKGANGSGPREREAFLFQEGRDLLWWYVEQIRGEFRDDAGDPHAPLFPSERLPKSVAALNMPIAPAVLPDTFRRAVKLASREYLKGTVTELFPHLRRHACATHNYESGMPLWDVQVLLGHTWASTTVGYLATAKGDPERQSLESSRRAVRRLTLES